MKTPSKVKPAPPKPDWWDNTSGCYCVVCLAPVKEEMFKARDGCCGEHKFDDPCTYT